jgi:hypothetical protein
VLLWITAGYDCHQKQHSLRLLVCWVKQHCMNAGLAVLQQMGFPQGQPVAAFVLLRCE